MVRKRSISNVLDDENPPTTRITVRPIVQPRRNRRVPCFCSDCKGNLVVPRTKLRHELLEEISLDINPQENINIGSSKFLENPEPQKKVCVGSSQFLENPEPQENVNAGSSQLNSLNEQQIVDEVWQEHSSRKRGSRSARVPISNNFRQEDLAANENVTENPSNDENDEDDEDNELPNNDNISEIFEDYSCPSFEPPFQEPSVNLDDSQFLWILLWIMKFRVRFNISETATESLIKFMKLVLEEIGGTASKEFPGNLYLARKALGLKDRFYSFVTCTKCHKLYDKQEVKDFRQDGAPAVMKCQHIEFPNSSKRQVCQNPLSHQITLLNEITNRTEMIYPFSTIRQQLAALYLQPGFENSLRHWANRPEFNNILTDVYDGQVWRTLKETSDHDSPNFFRPEVADSNLGLMLSVDWFQPYEGANHSTGVIYAAICNLPRNIRFKRENLLILGILPGPHEVSLHKIIII